MEVRSNMEKFITKEEFLMEEFKKAHERVDFELINVTKALYQKGCFISSFYNGIDKFRTCEECNCIRNKEIVFGEFRITKPTDENKEKCYQEFCSKKKNKIIEEVTERFYTLKSKSFEEWSKDKSIRLLF